MTGITHIGELREKQAELKRKIAWAPTLEAQCLYEDELRAVEGELAELTKEADARQGRLF